MDNSSGSGPARADDLDSRLIHALQEDGRASIQELAQRLGVPRDSVSQRLRALTRRDGMRVVAALDTGFAGHHLLTHAVAEVSGRVRPVAEQIAQLDGAVFVSMVSGAAPLVFESRHAGSAQLQQMLDRVRAIADVRRVRVSTYTEVLKGFFVAAARTAIDLDELDVRLIAALQTDGRESYRALADSVHLSPSSVRSRVRRLIDAGVIRIAAIPSGGLSSMRVAVGVGITLLDDAAPVREYIQRSSAIEFAARSHGLYDFIGTIGGSTTADVLEVIEEVRALPSVSAVQSWAHLDVVKEDYARTLGRDVRPAASGRHTRAATAHPQTSSAQASNPLHTRQSPS